jgi:hypothetical protein
MTICPLEDDVTEVLPNLWLGNYKSALNKDFIIKFNIKFIINITPNIPTPFSFVSYLHIPVRDDQTCDKNLNDLFDKSTDFIYNALKLNQGVLVHCMRGHHRSGSIVGAFLIRYLKIDFLDAVMYINGLRKCAMRRTTCMAIFLYSYCNYRSTINQT